MRRRDVLRGAVLVILSVAACGKKGPPLEPLRLVPEAPRTVTAVRMASAVSVRFVVPAANAAGGSDPVDIDRVDIYAVSLAAGAVAPPNRELLTPAYLVGAVPVRPRPVPGEPAPDPAVPDPRPGPGEPSVFVEQLTPELLAPPAPTTPSPPVVVITAGQIPSIPVVADVLVPKRPVRLYVARAVTRRGVAGSPSTRVQMPLVPPPPPVTAITATFTATAVGLSWTPPQRGPGTALHYNVYSTGSPAGPPLNPAPIAALVFERPGVEFGVEECFIVRSLDTVAGARIESEPPTEPACVTPRDLFPPAAPVGVTAVSSGGVVALIWDPNTDADLAGYLVLRAEASGDTLRPITSAPITDTVYRDTAVTPGVRYVYAIVAVDRASPPNTSAQSARIEVTAAQ